MTNYTISEKAKKDILTIGKYTMINWSEQQAEQYVKMILEECSMLSYKPHIGRSYDEYRLGLKGHSCGRHVIFDRVLTNGKIRIIRILHQMMDFPRHI